MHSGNQPQRGFTLIELVTTVMLIGILAAVAVPRLLGTASYSAHALIKEFMAELRGAQLQAMNNTDICIRVEVSAADGYRLSRFAGRSGDLCSGNLLLQQDWQGFSGGAGLRLLSSGQTSFNLDFDPLGRLPALGCAGPCIEVVADEVLPLAIESEGYIHGD